MGLWCRGGGKKFVSEGVSLQMSRRTGERMLRILSSSRYLPLPFSFAIRTSSTGHLAGVSTIEGSSVCFSAGTKRMCPVGMRIRVDMLVWPLTAIEVHGESSHTERTMTARNGSSVCSEEAKA